MTTLVNRSWTEPAPARYGAPTSADRMTVEVTVVEVCGRAYQNEKVWANGVLVVASQYPAGTGYAQKRVAKWTA